MTADEGERKEGRVGAAAETATVASQPPASSQVRLLLVDDEPVVTRSVERLLKRTCPGWACTTLNDSREALPLLDRESFDVVVSDLQMPGMDGAALLEAIQERHPEVVRIIVSGFADPGSTFRSVPFAHQLLAKPFNPEELSATLQSALALRTRLTNPLMRRLVCEKNQLPTAPQTFARLRRAMSRPETTVGEVASIVEQDPSLAAQVLRLATSGAFGLPKSASSIHTAVAYLGFAALEALVLSTELFSQYRPPRHLRGLGLEAQQRHGLVTGHVCRALAGQTEDADLAFLAGLLHDVGSVVLMTRAPAAIVEIHERCRREGITPLEAEQRILGVTHADIGAYLLGLWGMPHRLVEAVGRHHDPTADDPLATVVRTANLIANDPEAPVDVEPAELAQLSKAGILGRITSARSLVRALNGD